MFKAAVKEFTGKDFPDSAWEQLWGGICAVFDSWMNERAILYRRMNQIPEEWGTAVNVQAMVYGNMGDNSATGVAFSRDAATGENMFNGEYLINAQGEDVVAGIRTPQQITTEGSRRWAALQGISEEERASKYPSLEESMPKCAAELIAISNRLEDYYKDMQERLNADWWGGHYIRSYKEKALPMFKRFCECVSKSNGGYVFDSKTNTDEQSLVGKYVGILFGEEEYETNSGEVKTRLYVVREYSIEQIKAGKFKIPEIKKLASTKSNNIANAGLTDSDANFNPFL